MQNDSSSTIDVENTDCYPDHKTISSISEAKGHITKVDAFNYAISCSGEYSLLLPCNLPQGYKEEGMKVTFDGEVKEAKPEEMWAAQPFVLTSVKQSSE